MYNEAHRLAGRRREIAEEMEVLEPKSNKKLFSRSNTNWFITAQATEAVTLVSHIIQNDANFKAKLPTPMKLRTIEDIAHCPPSDNDWLVGFNNCSRHDEVIRVLDETIAASEKGETTRRASRKRYNPNNGNKHYRKKPKKGTRTHLSSSTTWKSEDESSITRTHPPPLMTEKPKDEV